MIGKTLGHYRITEKLGEGGMGVVYKARDLHLDRPVAIKVLPPEAVADPVRKHRFVQEAKAASALNHPNILHIYDINTGSAEQGGSADFIAMEYVSGPTLDSIIGGRALPLPEALRYATQIAEGLGAAHAAGIVHRDIKPGNLMVTEKGLVKILDFGLAKLTDTNEAGELASTRTVMPLSEDGAIIGTVSYMSPEQAEGKKVDSRSDIFSFGSVLYEMVTGKRAFLGDSKASILSAVLNGEPKPLAALVKTVPPELDRIVAQCLRKDPARRFQHLEDVKVLLDQLREDIDSGKVTAGRNTGVTAPRKITPAALTAALLTVLAVAGLLWWQNRPPPPAPMSVLTRLTSDAGLTTDPALSPDGKLLAYASDRASPVAYEGNLDIWVQQLPGGEPLRLTRHEADDREPGFSPDGTRIVFRSERNGGGIYTISALGGDERLIVKDGRGPRFSPDGQSIVYWTGVQTTSGSVQHGKIFVAPVSGSELRKLVPNFDDAWLPVWSPDGKRVLFVRTSTYPGESSWWITTLDGTASVVATNDFFAALGLTNSIPVAWQPVADRIVFTARSGDSLNVWQASLSRETWKITGEPKRLTFGSGFEDKPSVATLVDGGLRLVFAGLEENVSIGAVPIDADKGSVSGELLRLTQSVADDCNPALSPDGRRLFFGSDRTGNFDIWVKDLASGKETNLTNSPVDEMRPTISPDGSKLAYRSIESPSPAIYTMTLGQDSAGVTQHGPPQKVSIPGISGYPWSWSSDGTKLLYNCCPAGGPVRLFQPGSGVTTQVLGPHIYQVNFSPDDRWIAFGQHYPHGRERVSIAPLDGTTPPKPEQWIPVTDGANFDAYPRWSPNGNLLYFVSDRDGFRCIWAQHLDRATKRPAGSPFSIYHSHGSRRSLLNVGVNLLDISVARDKLAFPIGEITGNIWMTRLEGQK